MMKSKKWIKVSILIPLFALGGLIGSQVSGDIQEGLVAYFQFEEGNGDELDDSSGLGNNATISGDVEWVEGKYDKGMQFDGESSYVDIPPGTVGPFEAVTITAWVKLVKMPTTYSYNIAGMSTGPGSGLYVELYNVNLAAWADPRLQSHRHDDVTVVLIASEANHSGTHLVVETDLDLRIG